LIALLQSQMLAMHRTLFYRTGSIIDPVFYGNPEKKVRQCTAGDFSL